MSSSPLAERAARRSIADRQAAATGEVDRLVEAAHRVIERTGSFDPKMRDILTTAGLSTQAFYRHFPSKDDLLLVLIDDGRRQLVSYLGHRMAKAKSPEGQIRAWIDGVLAQAVDPEAAARTRPFLMNQDHLAERFPVEQRASVELLIDLLESPLQALDPVASDRRRDAVAIYQLAFGSLRQHAIDRTSPTRADIDHLVAFALAGVGRRTRAASSSASATSGPAS